MRRGGPWLRHSPSRAGLVIYDRVALVSVRLGRPASAPPSLIPLRRSQERVAALCEVTQEGCAGA
jgi:hypothetical protein